MRAGLPGALSWLLPAAAIVYLGFVLAERDLRELLGHLQFDALAVALAVAVAYGASLYLLAYSWSATLQNLAAAPVRHEAAIKIYAFSTFAKYLPGNVFHYAGRQFAGARLGYDQKAVAQATFVEIVGHLLVAGILMFAILPFSAGQLTWLNELDPSLSRDEPLMLVGAAVLTILVALTLVHRRFGFLPVLSRRILSKILLLQSAFFLMSTLLGAWLALVILALPTATFPPVAFAWLLAWLVGFLTPGAPGGLGVREACLVIALDSYGDMSAILIFIALSRATLLVGEGLFALSGFLLDPDRRHGLKRGAL